MTSRLVAALALFAVACGTPAQVADTAGPGSSLSSAPVGSVPGSVPGSIPGTVPGSVPPSIGMESPPPIVVKGRNRTLTLDAWTFCFANGCADGAPPAVLEDIGETDEVLVEFAIPDWRFEANFTTPGEQCGRRYPNNLEVVNPTTFRLKPQGPLGTYDVSLFGRGGAGVSRGGDAIVSFRWTTMTAGPGPAPKAEASILAENNGRVDSYGVQVLLHHLAAKPATAEGSVVVTAANGAAKTIPLARTDGATCGAGESRFDGSRDDALAAAALGPKPFRYDVTLTMDGTTHRASARWPDEVDSECSPCVPLRFDPPLPGLRS